MKGCTPVLASAHYLQRPFVITYVNSPHFTLQTPPIGSHKANENLRKMQALDTGIPLGCQGGKERLEGQKELIFSSPFHLFSLFCFCLSTAMSRDNKHYHLHVILPSFPPSCIKIYQHDIKDLKYCPSSYISFVYLVLMHRA